MLQRVILDENWRVTSTDDDVSRGSKSRRHRRRQLMTLLTTDVTINVTTLRHSSSNKHYVTLRQTPVYVS